MKWPFLMLFLIPGISFAGDPLKPCFDFSKSPFEPLRTPPSKFAEMGSETHEFGTDKVTQNDWAELSGQVAKPIKDVLQKIYNPFTIRDQKSTKVEVSEIPSSYLRLESLRIKIKPVFFITIEWQEDWAYQVMLGAKDAPKSVLIGYQKTKGTSHIKHLCGNILLHELTPTKTGVWIYEQVQADRRSAKDVDSGIHGTLRTLRE